MRREKRGEGFRYSPPSSGRHNLSYGTPLDELFVATRSSHRALHFYLRKFGDL
ncbi:uncharacterized protein DS421_10g296920 [Arachis hypogaea]|nr:uncharacterized protein DS421_10g296920 [Arachis hypogaea]